MVRENRFVWLDMVRGLAAVTVMAEHSFEAAGFSVGLLDPYHGLVNLGQVGVAAFFLVSGFIIPMSLEKASSNNSFWINRAFRIYPMYFLSFLLTVLFLGGRYDPITVISHLLFVQDLVPNVKNQVPNSWTLLLELIWYIGASTLFYLGLLKNGRLLTYAGLVLLFIVGIGACFSSSVPVGRFSMLVCFLVGMLLYRRVENQSNEQTRIYLLTFAIFAVLAIGFRISDGVAWNRFMPWTVLFSWALGFSLFFGAFRYGNLIPGQNVLSWLGRISYSVYLTHTFLIALGLYFGFHSVYLVIFVWASTVLIASGTYRFIERPSVGLGKSIIGAK